MTRSSEPARDAAEPAASSSAPSTPADLAAARSNSGFPALHRVVVVVSLCWLSLLFWMAATSANPVVLNAVQILRADYVVSADVEGGEVKAILKQWRGERLNAAITLLERNALPDGSYILPLTRSGDGFVVTPITASGKSPTVYPDTDETRTQLVALLEQRQLKN